MSENDSPKQQLKDLPTKSPDAAAQAREQAAEYGSIFAPCTLILDNGDTIEIPPHPDLGLFDDDALAAKEQLDLEIESYDRHPDIVIREHPILDKDGNPTGEIVPEETIRGALKVPYRKTVDGQAQLLNPPYTVQVAQIALGEDYAKLRAGTVNGHKGSAADVWRIWREQAQAVTGRVKSDSKSAGGAVDSAPVPAADPS